MEKTTNWIEKIKEAVRVAMNRGLNITATAYSYNYYNCEYRIIIDRSYIEFLIIKNNIILNTSNGKIRINYSLTDRENLEIQTLILSVKEYNENMAISEFEEFISSKEEKITDIDNIDDDD